MQLAMYLLDKRDNEKIEILDIRGTATPTDLKRSLLEMELTVELTNGLKGLHHGQIAPRAHESRNMTIDDWHYCIETYARNTGHEGQKYAAVLHTKKGSTHAHVVFERYKHETGTLIRDSFNYYDNNHTRAELEKHFGHEPTPWRRDKTHEQNHKKTLSEIWEYSKDGIDFIEQAEAMGYQVAKGLDRRPYKVITPDRQSLDLVRQLDGVKTAEVKKEFADILLQTEAEALRKIAVEKKVEIEEKRQEFIDNFRKQEDKEVEKKPESEIDDIADEMERLLKQARDREQDRGYTY
ncbi:relaxase/mobilization nuclease domain-containing protein [Dyadobacter sp. CY323]|nr:relaxase/mobilization nuclease domain-containing protein [Dyadobacter sp. CY323]